MKIHDHFHLKWRRQYWSTVLLFLLEKNLTFSSLLLRHLASILFIWELRKKIIKEADKKIIYIERLALTGWSGPMPTPYSDFIFRRSMLRDKAISNFLNSFNSRLLGISYQISLLLNNKMNVDVHFHIRSCWQYS